MARPRKQIYTLDMYLRKNAKGEIDNNADVQRNFVWKNEQINELIVTVLTDDYIPPVILGEEENSKLHIVDGGCRTAALRKFREMNYKVTSSLENSRIPYKRKVIDQEGCLTYEDAVFDIKNKTYEKLPEELKEKFDEYQIETVIHECCDSARISKYIKRYNNHVAMNTDQKAFTYIEKYANRIRRMADSRFFIECSSYSERDRIRGVVERIVVESLMCMNHFDNWKTQAKAACKYLNAHASEEEFDVFEGYLHRLENVITDDIKDIFNKKDSFIFLTLFGRFAKLETADGMFAEFLRAFQNCLRLTKRNKDGLLFDEIGKNLSTKDKQAVNDKLKMLECLMEEFCRSDEGKRAGGSAVEFISANLGMDAEEVRLDMEFYEESLDKLEEDTVRDGSRLLDAGNRLSLLAMMVYSYREDVDLDVWMAQYAASHNTYFTDQRRNFLHMRADFERFLKDANRRQEGEKEMQNTGEGHRIKRWTDREAV